MALMLSILRRRSGYWKRFVSKAKARAKAASASSSFRSTPHRALAAVHVWLLAFPLPVAWIFSLARWIDDHGSPASSQARTAAPSMGSRALRLLNCPENGSSMQTPMQSGPLYLWMIRPTPTVRLPMLGSSRTVWASKPPSRNTLHTPREVPRSRPRTNLRPNRGGFDCFADHQQRPLAAPLLDFLLIGWGKAQRDSNSDRRLAVSSAANRTASARSDASSSLRFSSGLLPRFWAISMPDKKPHISFETEDGRHC
jgi:hypothetical protein